MPERFDEDLRRIMEGYKEPFQPGHWTEMEKLLNRRKRRVFFLRSAAALLFLVVAGTATLLYLNSDNNNSGSENNFSLLKKSNDELKLDWDGAIISTDKKSIVTSEKDGPLFYKKENQDLIFEENEENIEEKKEEEIIREKHSAFPLESILFSELSIEESPLTPTRLESEEFKFKRTNIQTSISLGTAVTGNYNQLRPQFTASITIPVFRKFRIGGAAGFMQLDYRSGPQHFQEAVYNDNSTVGVLMPIPNRVDLTIDLATIGLVTETSLLNSGRFNLSLSAGVSSWLPLREKYRLSYSDIGFAGVPFSADPQDTFVFSASATSPETKLSESLKWKWNPSWIVLSGGFNARIHFSSRISGLVTIGGSLPMDGMGLNNERKSLFSSGIGLTYRY